MLQAHATTIGGGRRGRERRRWQAGRRRLQQAFAQTDTTLRFFGKPEVAGKRRMGVALARADNVEEAKSKAIQAASAVGVTL